MVCKSFCTLLVLILALTQIAPAAATPVISVPAMDDGIVERPIIDIAARPYRKKMSPNLERIRKRFLARRQVSFAELRSLADAGDSLAAYAFGKMLVDDGNPKYYTDAVHYFSRAAVAGRAYAIRPILKVLATPDIVLKPSHILEAERTLNKYAMRGNQVAINGLIDFYAAGSPFGTNPDRVTKLLEAKLVKPNAGDNSYVLAIKKLAEPGRTPKETQEIIIYLEEAALTGSVGIRASAANIIALLRSDVQVIQRETKP
jgi:TPR repeat protein